MQLFPAGTATFTCCTHLDSNTERPTFGESFAFPVAPRKLPSKTLQVNVWAVSDTNDTFDEECVVSSVTFPVLLGWSMHCLFFLFVLVHDQYLCPYNCLNVNNFVFSIFVSMLFKKKMQFMIFLCISPMFINHWHITSFLFLLQGYAQISLADFSLDTPQTRWYNILNFALLRPDHLTRDDLSSKSSTLRSSVSTSNVKVNEFVKHRRLSLRMLSFDASSSET